MHCVVKGDVAIKVALVNRHHIVAFCHFAKVVQKTLFVTHFLSLCSFDKTCERKGRRDHHTGCVLVCLHNRIIHHSAWFVFLSKPSSRVMSAGAIPIRTNYSRDQPHIMGIISTVHSLISCKQNVLFA